MSEKQNKKKDPSKSFTEAELEKEQKKGTGPDITAKEKIKRAEKAKPKKEAKEKKAGTGAWKRFVKFWKDFRGELKKIIWPDFKTVMKSTGIVIVTVCIIGAGIWIVDYALTAGVTGLKNLANAQHTTMEYDFEGTLPAEISVPTLEAEPGENADETQGETEAASEAATEPTTIPAAAEAGE
ncbi:MAG: preprotein translocase subunit SecE [Oscillospiraceae bacterium]|nr:preprotein translocase subunit SecE [Oscillospiraceae bacterium]